MGTFYGVLIVLQQSCFLKSSHLNDKLYGHSIHMPGPQGLKCGWPVSYKGSYSKELFSKKTDICFPTKTASRHVS